MVPAKDGGILNHIALEEKERMKLCLLGMFLRMAYDVLL
jgi:hypothetical protein